MVNAGVSGEVIAAISVIAVIALALMITGTICLWKKRTTTPDNRHVNALYGTYYNGVEYNTANDRNARYGRTEEDTATTEFMDTNPGYANNTGRSNEPVEEDDGYARLPLPSE